MKLLSLLFLLLSTNSFAQTCSPVDLIGFGLFKESKEIEIKTSESEFCFKNKSFQRIQVGSTEEWNVSIKGNMSLPFNKRYTSLVANTEFASTSVVMYGLDDSIYVLHLSKTTKE